MNTTVKKQKGIFYGWIVCAMCLLLMFVSMGVASNIQSVFLPYFIKDYGLTNAQASSLVTIRCFVAFVSLFLIGKYYDIFGYRAGTAIAAFCCALAHFIYAISTVYWQFCAGAVVAGISYGVGTMVPISILMNRWFYKHRALSIGICAAGSGIATIILPTLLTGIIEAKSLSYSLTFTAIFTAVFSVLIFIFISDKPSDKNLEPYGIEEMNSDDDENPEKKNSSDKKEKAGSSSRNLSRSLLAILILVGVFMGAVASPGFVHLSVLFTSEGFDPMYVAFLISLVGALISIFKILFGYLTDRAGGLRASVVFMSILIIGHALCCLAFSGSTVLAFITFLILGIGYAVSTVGLPVWAADMSSEEKYPETIRKLQIGYAAGAMLFASVPGVLADISGSYISSYVIFTAIMALSMVLIIFVYKKNKSVKNQ